MATDFGSVFSNTFKVSQWQTGLGTFGNIMLLLFFVILVVGAVGGVVAFILYRRAYRWKIRALGRVGGGIMTRWKSRAREVAFGREGDRLLYIKKRKKFVPLPKEMVGPFEAEYYERSDGELVNISYEDLDEKMKRLNLKFVDTDMRMERLGIAKNLEYRHQQQSWWQKNKEMVINAIFYVLVTLMLIIAFSQMAKTMEKIGLVADRVDGYLEKAEKITGDAPQNVPADQGGSGVIPAIVLLPLIRRFKNEYT